jgi:hypothetical protein
LGITMFLESATAMFLLPRQILHLCPGNMILLLFIESRTG